MRNLLMPESKYRIESYEPTPGQKRTQNMSELLQAIGGFTDRNNIPFLSSYADPRNANRTARQINNAYETVGDFIPGVSYELAKERNDDLGQNLAMLDLIPGGALPKKAIKGVQQVDFSTAVNRFKTNNPKSADYDKFVETKSEFIQGKMQDALNSSSIIQDPKNKAKYLKNTIREIENQLTNDFGKRGILDEVATTGTNKTKEKTLYHGSAKPIEKITSNKTFYMTENKDIANLYTDPGYSASVKSKENFENLSPTIIESKVKTDELFDTRIPEHKKIFENEFYGNYGNQTPLTEKGLPDWLETEDVADFIKDKKLPFKGVLVDEGGYFDEAGNVVDRGIGYAITDPSILANTKKIK